MFETSMNCHRRGFLRASALVWAGAAVSAFRGRAAETPNAGHAFLTAAWTPRGSQFVKIGAEGKVEATWQATGRHGVRDLWVLPNGNYLMVGSNHVRETTPDKQIIVEHDISKSGGKLAYSCVRLPNGNTLIATDPEHRLIELDPKGTTVKTVPIRTSITLAHHARRMVRWLPGSGRYLLCQSDDHCIREYDAEGKIAWEYKTELPWAAVRLPSGNTLLTTGKAQKKLVEIDPRGQTVWEVKPGDLPAGTLKSAYVFQRLPNGNTVVMDNFHDSGTLHLLEITPEKKVVWDYRNPSYQTLAFQLLDVPGDATRGEVLR